jgi:hypothetical protein
MQSYTVTFTLCGNPITTTYYGDALTTKLITRIAADLHKQFDIGDHPRKIKLLRIVPDPEPVAERERANAELTTDH